MYVYFIQQGQDGPIKVGYSTGPFGRLHGLQASHSAELRLLGYCRFDHCLDARDFEASLHERLSRYLIRNEWYEPSRAVLKVVREFSTERLPTPPEAMPQAWVWVCKRIADHTDYQQLLVPMGDECPACGATEPLHHTHMHLLTHRSGRAGNGGLA